MDPIDTCGILRECYCLLLRRKSREPASTAHLTTYTLYRIRILVKQTKPGITFMSQENVAIRINIPIHHEAADNFTTLCICIPLHAHPS